MNDDEGSPGLVRSKQLKAPPRVAAAAAALVLLAAQAPAPEGPGLAFVENHSRPTLCAEDRNVVYTLSGPEIERFQIEASAPVYLPDLKAETATTDPADCPPRTQAGQPSAPRVETLFESEEIRVLAESRSAPAETPAPRVAVAEAVRSDVARIRWLQKFEGDFHEILTVDLSDGALRLRPVPTEAIPNASYGIEIFVGPVERRPAPAVAIDRLKIDPAANALRMTFVKGGVAEVRFAAADRRRVVLEATVDGLPKPVAGQPFAAIRSMHVWPTKALVGRINWTTTSGVFNEPVMDFRSGYASEVRFDRIEVSKLGAGAPDITFRGFQHAPPAGR